jgi:hypothetical protein
MGLIRYSCSIATAANLLLGVSSVQLLPPRFLPLPPAVPALTGRSCSLLEFPGQDLVVPLLWLPPAVEAAPFVFSVCKAWSFDVLACQGFDLVAFLVQNFSSSWPFLVVHARCSMKGF